MKYIRNFLILICLSIPLSAGQNSSYIGDVSFKDAVWDDSGNLLFSRQKVSDLTRDGRAVILYLFEACFS
jgi:hypothetical protein